LAAVQEKFWMIFSIPKALLRRKNPWDLLDQEGEEPTIHIWMGKKEKRVEGNH